MVSEIMISLDTSVCEYAHFSRLVQVRKMQLGSHNMINTAL
jgi:hypothetical protein